MKIKQITEAKYQESKPQYRNLPSSKVIQMFFDEEKDATKDHSDPENIGNYQQHLLDSRWFYPSSGLTVRVGNDNIQNVVVLTSGKFVSVEFGEEGDNFEEYDVDPSTFDIYKMTLVHEG